MTRQTTKLASVLGLSVILIAATAQPADARRGGSFGSRGMRTYSAPAPTRTAPQQAAPVQRSMTTPTKGGSQAVAPNGAAAAAQPARRGFLGGMGGGLLGGLVAGGLIGAMLGNGFGGLGAGLMNTLMQVALIGGGIMLVMMLLRRRRQQPQAGFAGASPAGFGGFGGPTPNAFARDATPYGGGNSNNGGGFAAAFGGGAAAATPNVEEFQVTQADRDAFERLLSEVQSAFGSEDYGSLRSRTTPEVMSYLSEELSQNATQGRRNQVSGTRLLQADVGEAWREGNADFATAAMRYESVDVMVDRDTGAVLEGDPNTPTQTTELWTFTRQSGMPWKLSAIQEA